MVWLHQFHAFGLSITTVNIVHSTEETEVLLAHRRAAASQVLDLESILRRTCMNVVVVATTGTVEMHYVPKRSGHDSSTVKHSGLGL